MKIEKIPLSELTPDPSNTRKHSEKNLDAIKGSLLKFGQQKPIVVDSNNVIVAGNGTFEAARQIGWTELNCVRTALAGTELIAYGIADNRTGELAAWNDNLGDVLKGLDTEIDLNAIGFDEEDLLKFIDYGLGSELEKTDEEKKEIKYILEIEFPDDQARKDEYENLVSQGLIVRFK